MDIVKEKSAHPLFYFLLILVLIRPCLDILSRWDFQIHSSLPSVNLNVIIGGLVFLILIIFFLLNLKKIYSTPLFYPIFCFLGLTFISIFYSIDNLSSIREFIRLASIFLLYFLAYQLTRDKQDWRLLVKFIFLSYALPAIVAIVQFFGKCGLPDDFGGFQRIYGTFSHPNPFALYTFFVLALAIILLLIQKEKKIWSLQNPYLLISAGSILLLLGTYSRSALACFLIFLFLFGIFKYRRLIIFGLLLFIIFYLLSDVFQERILSLIYLDPYGSVVWRFRLWLDMIPVAFWHPWFGHGLDTFTNLNEFYRGFKWGSLEAHNDYLKIFLENGVLGLAAYFWLVIGLLYNLWRIFRKKIGENKIIGLGLSIIFISILAVSGFDNILRETAFQWSFWALLGSWIKINK